MKLFDWSRGKKKFDDETMNKLVSLIANVLNAQITIAGGSPFNLATSQGAKALGYVYGMVDAALRVVGQDMADISIGVPVIYQVLRRIFPGQEDRYLEFISQSIQNNRDMMIGVMKGGQQYLDWLNGKLNMPMGLARYLLELGSDQPENQNT